MNRPRQNTKRTLLANSAYIFLIRFFPALASTLAMILFSRHLDPALYGRYQNFWVQWAVLNGIACLGLPALLLTIPAVKMKDYIRAIHTKQLLVFAGWLVCAGLVFALLLFQTIYNPWVGALFLIVGTGIAILESYLITARTFGIVAVSSGGYAVLFAVLHVLFLQHSFSFQQLFLYLLLANIVRLVLLSISAWPLYKQMEGSTIDTVEKASLQKLWFHLGVYDIVQVVFRFADKFILSFLLAPALFAVYFNGTIDIPFLSILLGAVGSALVINLSLPHLDDAERVRLLRYSSTIMARIVFPLFFFLAFFRQELFAVVFKNKYNDAVPLFLLSILVVPLRAYNFTSILQSKAKGHLINLGALLDLFIALVLMYPLYLAWGLKGIALAFVISTYIQAMYYLVHTAKLLSVKWFHLLPLRAWLVQLIVFSITFIILYYALHAFFSEAMCLFLGAGITGLLILLLLLPEFLSRKNTNDGQTIT